MRGSGCARGSGLFLLLFSSLSCVCVCQMLESISVADREQQLVLARSEYQHVLSSHEHAKQQFDGEGWVGAGDGRGPGMDGGGDGRGWGHVRI